MLLDLSSFEPVEHLQFLLVSGTTGFVQALFEVLNTFSNRAFEMGVPCFRQY